LKTAKTGAVAASVEHKQNVRRNVPQTAELLRDAVFEYEDIVEFERRIVMAVGVERDDWQADFFSENSDRLLLFFLDWRRW
jgi:hypothetical protein